MGARNHRFRFTADAGTTDTTTGAHTEDWSDVVCERWARFAPDSDAAFTALRGQFPGMHFGLELAYDPVAVALSPAHRAVGLTLGSREFDVLGVRDPDGRRRHVQVAIAERFVTRSIVT